MMKKITLATVLASAAIILSSATVFATTPFCNGGISINWVKGWALPVDPMCTQGVYRVKYRKDGGDTKFSGKIIWSDVLDIIQKPQMARVQSEFLPGARQNEINMASNANCSALKTNTFVLSQTQYMSNLDTCIATLNAQLTPYVIVKLKPLNDTVGIRSYSAYNLPQVSDYNFIKGDIKLRFEINAPDTDGDGFPDYIDNCDHIPFPTNLGCPLN